MTIGFGSKIPAFLSSLSGVMFVGKILLFALGAIHPSVHGLIALVCLVFIQREAVYRLIGIVLIVAYLRMLFGSSFGFEALSRGYSATLSDESGEQGVDECSSSGEYFVTDDHEKGNGPFDRMHKDGCVRTNNGCSAETFEASHSLLNGHRIRCRFCSGLASYGI
ncbi:hypothetical protein M970_081750 [Encephalitozoon cuniculi EcunIII-L]|uniref:Uncharacterized protein n=1 Tax=Encephalitozoon cuniculi TaxID=6035 RepID=M1JIE6_ENCCN|nr:hypothetical protein ECU08_1750 [Encephalitozoon cuniculi]KMV65700.1 hypothetical protein M970_081750 [Encephalitozoon cuniculi EcunIII-L]UYI27106.1 hypothetical protein J0A71_04g09560 [Encephalitozoon cuniculi]